MCPDADGAQSAASAAQDAASDLLGSVQGAASGLLDSGKGAASGLLDSTAGLRSAADDSLSAAQVLCCLVLENPQYQDHTQQLACAAPQTIACPLRREVCV